MRIVISDSSCLIDMHKGGLLRAMLQLPYEFIVPELLFKTELHPLPDAERRQVVRLGLQVQKQPGEQMSEAQRHFNDHGRLQFPDYCALVLARETGNGMLFTGDKRLKTYAESLGIEVHGVLWCTDLLETHGVASTREILDALLLFKDDPLVRLPEKELDIRIRRLKKAL